MELNSTQEASVVSAPTVGKKTTIQLFASTTEKLTKHKRGNDTYDDVINRHMTYFETNGGTKQ